MASVVALVRLGLTPPSRGRLAPRRKPPLTSNVRRFLMSTLVILSRRYGGDVRNPTSTAEGSPCRAVLEPFGHDRSRLRRAGSAFLRFGEDEGPMYVVYVTRTGRVTFEQWADQDFMVELAEPSVLPSQALRGVFHLVSSQRRPNPEIQSVIRRQSSRLGMAHLAYARKRLTLRQGDWPAASPLRRTLAAEKSRSARSYSS
jgi:hypothetical protein